MSVCLCDGVAPSAEVYIFENHACMTIEAAREFTETLYERGIAYDIEYDQKTDRMLVTIIQNR